MIKIIDLRNESNNSNGTPVPSSWQQIQLGEVFNIGTISYRDYAAPMRVTGVPADPVRYERLREQFVYAEINDQRELRGIERWEEMRRDNILDVGSYEIMLALHDYRQAGWRTVRHAVAHCVSGEYMRRRNELLAYLQTENDYNPDNMHLRAICCYSQQHAAVQIVIVTDVAATR